MNSQSALVCIGQTENGKVKATCDLRSRSLVGNAINLDFAINNHAGDDTGARRRIGPEVFLKYRVKGREVARVVKPYTTTDDVFRSVSGFAQDRQQVANRLLRLSHNIAGNDSAIDHGNLA